MGFIFRAVLLALLVGFINATPVSIQDWKVIGYYTNYAQYRACSPYYMGNVWDVASKLTNLHFAFAEFNETGYVLPIEWNDCLVQSGWSECGTYSNSSFTQLQAVKQAFPHLKTSITVGGYSWGGVIACPYFSIVAANATIRAFFVSQLIGFARTFEFDGIVIDWEYPTDTTLGCVPEDSSDFFHLMLDLRTAINAEAAQTGNTPLLLSMEASANPTWIIGEMIASIYNQSTKILDYLDVLTFDYYGSWSTTAGFVAPLYDPENLSVSSTIQYLLSIGVPASDIVMGVPAYGASFDASADSPPFVPGIPVAVGEAGPCTGGAGSFAYFEILDFLEQTGVQSVFNSTYESEYSFAPNGDPWIGYDGIEGLQTKIQWAYNLGLGGAMVWTLDYDDFENGYPIVTNMWPVIADNTTTTSTSTAATSTSTTGSSSSTTSHASTSTTSSSSHSSTSSSSTHSTTTSTSAADKIKLGDILWVSAFVFVLFF